MTVRFQEREVTAAIIEGVVNGLREVLGEPEALINIAIADGVHFDTGFALKEFAKLAGIELKPGRRESGGLRMALAKAAANTESPKARAQVPHTLGFAVPATSDPHHFKVVIPKSSTGKVQISEHLGLQAASADSAVIDRVLLDRPRWTAIRAEVQRAFNARLSAHSLKPGAWKVGDTPVDRLLGKELCVLAWAVEQMDTEKIPVAVRNWLALRPEERWWLFGMTAMSTGGLMDAGKGWRAALKDALGDVAQSEWLAPRARSSSRGKDDPRPSLDLFGDET